MTKTFLLAILVFVSHAAAGGTLPFRSDETFTFLETKDQPLFGMFIADASLGRIHREDARLPETRYLDLFDAPDAPISLTAAYCEKLTRDILYMRPEFPMRIEKTELFKARFGNACEVAVYDADPETRHRQVVISWVNRKAYAFVAVFPRGTTPDPQDLRAFVTSLR